MSTYINEDTRRAVFRRQEGYCALCGRKFTELDDAGMSINFHHVYPAQFCGPGDQENVVAVCRGAYSGIDNLSCHYRVHANGSFGSGIVAPPSYYEYSHGLSKVAHRHWAAGMQARFGAAFGD